MPTNNTTDTNASSQGWLDHKTKASRFLRYAASLFHPRTPPVVPVEVPESPITAFVPQLPKPANPASFVTHDNVVFHAQFNNKKLSELKEKLWQHLSKGLGLWGYERYTPESSKWENKEKIRRRLDYSACPSESREAYVACSERKFEEFMEYRTLLSDQIDSIKRHQVQCEKLIAEVPTPTPIETSKRVSGLVTHSNKDFHASFNRKRSAELNAKIDKLCQEHSDFSVHQDTKTVWRDGKYFFDGARMRWKEGESVNVLVETKVPTMNSINKDSSVETIKTHLKDYEQCGIESRTAYVECAARKFDDFMRFFTPLRHELDLIKSNQAECARPLTQ